MVARHDDFAPISVDLYEHINDLQSLLQKLREIGLRANYSKCHFCRQERKYLGHVVSEEGLLLDPEKIRAIQEMPSPRRLTPLTTLFFADTLLASYARIAQPLPILTKKTFPDSGVRCSNIPSTD